MDGQKLLFIAARPLKIYLLLLILASVTYSCKTEPKATSESATTVRDTVAASQALNQWFEDRFQEAVDESPQFQTQLGIKKDYGKWDDISSKKEAEDLKKNKEQLAYLNDSIDPGILDESTRLSYDLAKMRLENDIASYDFRFYNYPVNQMHGMQAEIPAFLINMHRIESLEDAKAYISRVQGTKALFEELVNNLQIRESNHIMPPKFVYAKVLDDSKNIIKGEPFDPSKEKSTLLADFEKKVAAVESIEDTEREKLIADVKKALVDSLKPAYEQLITTLEDQQKRAVTDDGVWKFPKGDAYYALRLKNITTTSMSAEEIHQLGLKEVDRIHGEMRDIMKKVKFEGTLQDFFEFMRTDKQFYYQNTPEGKEKYLKEAVALIDTMKANLDKLFIIQPKADIIVKAVESFREKSAGKAFYQRGTPDGSRPGTYYANLYDMESMPTYQMEALAYHEGIPGHHMQISIAQELEDIPKFRKFRGYTAYIEGWGLYSELVPKEIGMYEDPYSDFGRLAMELWRACRLVVDTGIHDKKWTREEGIDYYKKNTPNAELDAIKMVERHIVMPGQATAYKIGMNKIRELRDLAKGQLGEDFDIREFHDVILKNGAVPLNVLENLVKTYILEKQESKTVVAAQE